MTPAATPISNRDESAITPRLPSACNPWSHLAVKILHAAIFVYALSLFIPWELRPSANILDASWLATLHWAHLHHADFGHDIVFTYGPWGFTVQGFLQDTFAPVVAVWTLIAIAVFAAGVKISRHMTPSPWRASLWLLLFIALAGAARTSADVLLYAITWLLLVIHFFVDDSPLAGTKILLAIVMALTSLMKFSIAAMAAPVILVITLDQLRRRRFPTLLFIYLAAFVGFWLLARQKMSSLLPYLQHSWMVARGYAGGERLELPTDQTDIAWFLVWAAMLFIPIAAFKPWQKSIRTKNLLAATGLAVVIFALFKAGFVRHDGHETIATISIALLATVWLAAAWPATRNDWSRLLLLAFAVGSWFYADARERVFKILDTRHMIANSLVAFPFSAAHAVHWIADPYTAPQPCVAYLRTLRGPSLSAAQGRVDIYSTDQQWAVANAVDFHPRPIFQSYVAFTSELAQMNADFLSGPNAPDTIFFDLQPIDRHYPAQEDGLSWPLLLSRYQPFDATRRWLALRRDPANPDFSLQPLAQISSTLGRWITLPASSDPVWVSINVKNTMLGDLADFFYRPPGLVLGVRTADDGNAHYFTFLQNPARSGFLLSPMIEDRKSFASLKWLDWNQRLHNLRISQLVVFVRDPSRQSPCIQPNFTVDFYSLRIPHSDLSQVPGLAH